MTITITSQDGSTTVTDLRTVTNAYDAADMCRRALLGDGFVNKSICDAFRRIAAEHDDNNSTPVE